MSPKAQNAKAANQFCDEVLPSSVKFPATIETELSIISILAAQLPTFCLTPQPHKSLKPMKNAFLSEILAMTLKFPPKEIFFNTERE